MGLTVTIAFHQIEDVVFDDVKALNDDLLQNTSFGELYGDINPGQVAYQNNDIYDGPFQYNGPAEIKIANVEDSSTFGDYNTYTEVWSCFGEDEAQVIANHITQGKLVFLMDVEGHDNEFWILTPGKVAHKYESEVKF